VIRKMGLKRANDYPFAVTIHRSHQIDGGFVFDRFSVVASSPE